MLKPGENRRRERSQESLPKRLRKSEDEIDEQLTDERRSGTDACRPLNQLTLAQFRAAPSFKIPHCSASILAHG